MDLVGFTTVIVSLLAIVNPVGSVPTFMLLTDGCGSTERRRVARLAVTAAASTLLVFSLLGELIFNALGITLPAFRIAGGILIFLYALELLHGERPRPGSTARDIHDALERDSVAVTPLGVPLLAGPGAITTVMLLVARSDGGLDAVAILAAIVLVYVAAYVILLRGEALMARLGRSGLMMFARIMGLLLAAIAVQFVINGLRDVVRDLFAAPV